MKFLRRYSWESIAVAAYVATFAVLRPQYLLGVLECAAALGYVVVRFFV